MDHLSCIIPVIQFPVSGFTTQIIAIVLGSDWCILDKYCPNNPC